MTSVEERPRRFVEYFRPAYLSGGFSQVKKAIAEAVAAKEAEVLSGAERAPRSRGGAPLVERTPRRASSDNTLIV